MLDNVSLLAALRGEQSVETVCATAGITEAEFRRERDAALRRRLPPSEQRLVAGVAQPVEIRRDGHGVPHIYAQTTPDLFFGLGLTMAQDRLWQMDCYRRRGQGRLAEILGPAALASDVTHRTLELDHIAAREAEQVEEPARTVLASFVAGINRAIEAAGASLPIEFDVLGYRPEPWTVPDVLVSARAIWWALSGRLQSIATGEAAGLLPEGPLRDAFLTPEFADERIVPGAGGVGAPAGSDDSTTGSNNWAVGGGKTRSGAGILCSDPHQPLALPSNRYECRLLGPEDDLIGAAWVGSPLLTYGRNRRIAWGLTNNNASTRDLYVEEVHPQDPRRYRDGADWRPFTEREVQIAVRGRPPERLRLRRTVRGPVVNHLMHPVGEAGDPPLSLRWVGQEHLDEVNASLAVGRAQNWDQFRDALRHWALPVYNWGYADVDGHCGYQLAARLPVRGRVVRGFRQASNPDDAWTGSIPFDALPRLSDPPRGFITSANNVPFSAGYPSPIYGAFASGARALRIRETLDARHSVERQDLVTLQNDTLSPRARWLGPGLARRLAGVDAPEVQEFCRLLADWDYRYDVEAVAATLFELFWQAWKRRVAAERFQERLLGLVQESGSLGGRLIEADDLPWFESDKQAALVECVQQAMAQAREQFGPDRAGWRWGAVHRAQFRHPLSTPALADACDVGPRGVAGAADTVRNTGLGSPPRFAAESGAEYRLVADLADGAGLWATQSLGQSGQPGSPHYADQFEDWVAGRYHTISFDRPTAAEQTGRVALVPARGVER